MKFIAIFAISIFLNSCASMPELFKTIDDVATDDCVTIKVDRDAFTSGQNVKVNLGIDVESTKSKN